DTRRMQNITKGEEIVGGRIKTKVVKNKVAPPFREAEFDLFYETGISYEGSLLDVGLSQGIITQKGAFYSYSEKTIGQGRDKAVEFLKSDKKVAGEIEKGIREKKVEKEK
ncbi:MAG: hypothetical protein AAB267_08765, partial [Candidatus Desantisbacteria bacterium]